MRVILFFPYDDDPNFYLACTDNEKREVVTVGELCEVIETQAPPLSLYDREYNRATEEFHRVYPHHKLVPEIYLQGVDQWMK